MKRTFLLAIVSWAFLLVFTLGVVKAQSAEKKVAVGNTKSASFPGGISALFKFLADSVKYPKSVLAHPIKQKVGVQIDVNEDGTISHVVTPPELREDFEMEALRVITKMPKWSPALRDGLPIKSTVFFNISFIPPK